MKDALAEYAVKEAFLKKSSGLLRQKRRGAITSADMKARIIKFIDDNRERVLVSSVELSCGQFKIDRYLA